MRGIVKRYGDFIANDHIDFSVRCGEVHALLGENGSGKTTLMSILYGLKSFDEGEIFIFGKKAYLRSPTDAMRCGVGMVHQHFMLVQKFSVLENIILGHESLKCFGRIDYVLARKKVQELMQRYQLFVDLDATISDLSVNAQQRVEILKALYGGARILILDEPTAALTPHEIESLFAIVKNFRDNNLAVVLVTHKLKEILCMADRCTVIRQGKLIDCFPVNNNTTEEELAAKMVGREIILQLQRNEKIPGEILFNIQNLCAHDYRGVQIVDDVSFSVRAGEIVGLVGVQGNGLDELAEIIPGLMPWTSGSISILGKTFAHHHVRDMMDAGLANIPASRHKHGLVLEYSLGYNLVLKNISQQYAHRGIINEEKIFDHAEGMIEKFDIRTPMGPYSAAAALSGGNQQKIIIAREVHSQGRILLAVNPTRGLDVGAIEFVRRALLEEREKNKAIILISYELAEILNLCDHILVMFRGKIVSRLSSSEADERKLGLLMTGGGAV